MLINLDGLEIMVRMRCEDIRQEKENSVVQYKRSGFTIPRRALITIGGLLVSVGMTLEKLGIGREVYHLSTTASR
ncbi:MAG: hypothetical protein PVF49_07480 [Anaerolineales bacterium]